MENYNTIIKENIKHYIQQKLLIEYKNKNISQRLNNVVSELYTIYNDIINDIQNHPQMNGYSKNDYVVKKFEHDIHELEKDIKLFNRGI